MPRVADLHPPCERALPIVPHDLARDQGRVLLGRRLVAELGALDIGGDALSVVQIEVEECHLPLRPWSRLITTKSRVAQTCTEHSGTVSFTWPAPAPAARRPKLRS